MDFRYPLTLPDFGPNAPFQFTVTNSFTAEVNLAFADPSCGGACFHLDAFGYGTATATLHQVGPKSYQLANVNYVFTPEPATVMLSGLGSLAVIVLHRRARRPFKA